MKTHLKSWGFAAGFLFWLYLIIFSFLLPKVKEHLKAPGFQSLEETDKQVVTWS